MFDFTEKDAARWEKRRAGGKWRFVLRSALLFTLSSAVMVLLLDLFYGSSLGDPMYYLLLLPFAGVLGSLGAWWREEGQYKNYMLDRHIEKILGSDH